MAERLTTPDIHLHRVMLSKHRRGPWSTAEDQYLLDLVRTQGASNWVRISQLIGSRSPKQCRERYHQNLKPSLNLDPITPEEGVLIERMVAEMGKRWAEIARRLHGRSDNAVKNWWNGGMNRRKRLDNRRAELAPRQAQSAYHHHHHHHTSLQAQPAYDSYAPRPHEQPAPLSYTHSYAAPAVQTPTSSYASSHRYAIEAPLHSPSAFSTVSRAESAEGGAPSLISDVSYATYSHPNTPPSATELPPLSLLDARYQHAARPSPPTSYPLSSSFPSKQQEYAGEVRGYPLLAEQWRERPTLSLSPRTRDEALPYAGPQLSLPSFHTITAPQVRSGSPASPAKDNRMDLSKLLA